MNPKFKKRLRIFVVLAAPVLALLIGWAIAPSLLIVDSGPHTANAEVILGGEPWTRPVRGAEIFQEAGAGFVIVSGDGDCEDVRRQIEARGVPAGSIVTECQSRTTQENALFSAKILRARAATNAVIVTSWYHSRRALACFQKAAPEIVFYSRPVARPPVKSWWPDAYQRKRITQEYAKIVYYWVAYGVSPFL